MISVEDLKAQLKEYNYNALCDSDDDVALRCIENAVVYIKAKLKNCTSEVDFEDDVVRQALIKRALYELYAYAENEQLADDKKQAAIEILRGYFGDCVSGSNMQQANSNSLPIVSLKKGSDSWDGFK
jgi:hypothetical protein